ncbi:MAG: DUF1819 family protein [Candidatus Adiutrix sp.]|jgi:hypothetical protein|nr:DUF1819 family protein [Candidatus Adiutrix sp.]
MNNDRYSLSFTTGGLFHRESVKLAELYLPLGDWDGLRNAAISRNILQSRTLSTLKRVFSEVVSRLKTFSPEELHFLVTAGPQDQGYLLWLAVCRRYTFIGEFAVEVVRERYLTLKADLCYDDFDSFFHKKSERHSGLDKITPATRAKLRQVLFKMLREADILSARNLINPAIPGQGLLSLLLRGNRRGISFLPVFEPDLKTVGQ